MARYLSLSLALAFLTVALVYAGTGQAEALASVPDATTQELPQGVTPAMIEQGETVYRGNGFCMTCHGDAGQGTPVGPNLVNGEWIQIDGSYESIVEVVMEGQMEPAEYPGIMLPRGGSDISDDEARAVSAYVWSISRGE